MKPAFHNILIVAAMLSLSVLSACGADHDRDAPTRANFAAALDTFLAARGDICLAMFDWPIDLTEAEAGAGTSRARQLPVFEKLGLLSSTVVAVPKSRENPDGAVKRYRLTEEGRKYYRAHAYTERDGVKHPRDFCVARITRDRVVHWTLDTHDPQHPSAVVSYTYRIDPAPWLQDAAAQRVLPMVTRIIDGANGRAQLHQGFTLGAHGWVATHGPV